MATDLPDAVLSESDRVKELERRLQSLERENRHLKRTLKTSSPDIRASKATETESGCLLENLDDVNLDELLDEDDDESWVYQSPVKPSPQQRLLTPEQWLLQGLHNGDSLSGSGRLPRDELVDIRTNLYPESNAGSTIETRSQSGTPSLEGRVSGRTSPESTSSRASNSTYTVSPTPPLSDVDDENCGSPDLRRSPLDHGQLQGQRSRPTSQTPDDDLAIKREASVSPLPTSSAVSHVPPAAHPVTSGLSHPSGISGLSQPRPTSGLTRPSTGIGQSRPASGLTHPQASSSGLAQPSSRRSLAGGPSSSQRSLSQPKSSLPQAGAGLSATQHNSQLTRPSGTSRLATSTTGASRLARPAAGSQGAGASSTNASSGTAGQKSGLMRPAASGLQRSGLRAPQPARPSSASGLRAPASYAGKKMIPRPNSASGRSATSENWKDGCY